MAMRWSSNEENFPPFRASPRPSTVKESSSVLVSTPKRSRTFSIAATRSDSLYLRRFTEEKRTTPDDAPATTASAGKMSGDDEMSISTRSPFHAAAMRGASSATARSGWDEWVSSLSNITRLPSAFMAYQNAAPDQSSSTAVSGCGTYVCPPGTSYPLSEMPTYMPAPDRTRRVMSTYPRDSSGVVKRI